MNPETTIWEVKKWRKQKQAQIKRLKTILKEREQELLNLIAQEEKLEALENAIEIIGSK